jgi:PKD repeat protein
MSNITQTVVVTNAPCLGTLSFSYYNGANGNVWFNNTSGVPNNWNYTFAYGDGTTQSYSPFPMNTPHTYTAGGAYNVTVTAVGGGCTYSAVQTISVNMNACNINANYTYTVGANGMVNFSNASTGTVSGSAIYTWNFGDGSAGWGPNVSHTYFNNGLYNVSLTVSDSSTVWCSDSIVQQVNLNGSCFANVNFWMWKDSSAVPAIVWDAYAVYPNNMVSTVWSWGDGSTSTGLFPSHTYSAAGMYNICVTVSVACGATATTCYNANIFKTTGSNNAMAVVNVKNASAPTAVEQADINPLSILLFPNPSSGEIEVRATNVTDNTVQIRIYNVLGQEVYSCSEENTTGTVSKQIDLANLSSGSYFVKVITGKGSQNSKLILSK